jgi:O-antigen ligase
LAWFAALGGIMLMPRFRLPALVLGLLSIPGNVDNYVPQMQMDFHLVPNNTGPAVSVVDVLILWSLVLTLREGRRAWPPDRNRLFVAGAMLLAGAVVASSVAAIVLQGVEPLAGVRGMLAFARIPMLVCLSIALLPLDPSGVRICAAATIGGVGLLSNGIYTSAVEAQSRFTASTFGRNGLGMVLALVALLAAGVAVESLRRRVDRRWAAVAAPVAAATLFGAIATGTRMSLFALIIGLVGAAAVNRLWRTRTGAIQLAAGIALGIATIAASTVLSPAGGRAIDLGSTVDAVVDYEDLPSSSEVRTRGEFWAQAVEMSEAHPLTGVGAYQWNIQRYALEPNAPKGVINPHNTYLQIGAEFGIPVLVIYLGLLVAILATIASTQLRSDSTGARSWSAAFLVGCAAAYPVTELTNSHLFNVRLGAVGWLVLGTALAMALSDLSERRRTTQGELLA